MNRDPRKPEDIERIKRVLYLLYSSGSALNFFERTHQKDLGLFELKLKLIKSEKPRILFKKAPRTKGMIYVYLDLNVNSNSELGNTVSQAKIPTEEADKFEVEIQQQGYVIKTGTGYKTLKIYELTA